MKFDDAHQKAQIIRSEKIENDKLPHSLIAKKLQACLEKLMS